MSLNKPKLLYHLDFYDHPLSGVCEYQGEKLYVEYTEDDDGIDNPSSDLLYALFRMPKYILNHIEKEHKVFQEMVGYHTDRGDIYKPFGSTPNQFNEYYKTPRPSPPYTQEEFLQATERVAVFRSQDFIDFYR